MTERAGSRSTRRVRAFEQHRFSCDAEVAGKAGAAPCRGLVGGFMLPTGQRTQRFELVRFAGLCAC